MIDRQQKTVALPGFEVFRGRTRDDDLVLLCGGTFFILASNTFKTS